jgi:ferritin
MNYLNSRDAKVELLPIVAVPSTWGSVLDMFKQTLEHEKRVTGMIQGLMSIAKEDKDYASENRLIWFVDEQVEEEESAREMIANFDAVEGNKYGMYMLDKELATRVFNIPSPLATA